MYEGCHVSWRLLTGEVASRSQRQGLGCDVRCFHHHLFNVLNVSPGFCSYLKLMADRPVNPGSEKNLRRFAFSSFSAVGWSFGRACPFRKLLFQQFPRGFTGNLFWDHLLAQVKQKMGTEQNCCHMYVCNLFSVSAGCLLDAVYARVWCFYLLNWLSVKICLKLEFTSGCSRRHIALQQKYVS